MVRIGLFLNGKKFRIVCKFIVNMFQLESVRGKLQSMEPDGRIIIHGLTGSGKSCLAAASIREKHLLKLYFKYKVFWINLGDVKSDEQILRHMHR